MILFERGRKGEELKAPHYTSAAASCNNYVTIYNIIPNKYDKQFKVIVDSRVIKNYITPSIVKRLKILYKEKEYLYLLVIILGEPVLYKDSIINLKTGPI